MFRQISSPWRFLISRPCRYRSLPRPASKDDDQELKPSRISAISPGNCLEINAYLNSGAVVASSIVRRKANEYEVQILRGRLTAINTGMNAIDIQGIQFSYDLSVTSFESNDSEINGMSNINNFLSGLNPGDIIQIKEQLPIDGTVDELELKD